MSQPESSNAPGSNSTMQESGSPHRGEVGREGQPPMGFPPQGPYGGQGNYPAPYAPQGPYGGPYGPPPGNGYAPPSQQPFGYPPGMHSPYGYGGYGGPPPSYGYGGGGGGFPTQQAQGPGGKPQKDDAKPGKKGSPSRSKSESPVRGGGRMREGGVIVPAPPQPPVVNTKLAEDLEHARLRASSSADSGVTEVDPMRTAFHFFVKDVRQKYEEQAEEEVRNSTENYDKFLLFSNLNGRLMKAWEDAPQEERDSYMVKEEEDRRRFMSDDEIASRHCATLTARAKSPRASEKKERELRYPKPQSLPLQEPLKKDEDTAQEEPAAAAPNEETKKRSSPTGESNSEDGHPDESPPKKSKASDDTDEGKKKDDEEQEESQST